MDGSSVAGERGVQYPVHWLETPYNEAMLRMLLEQVGEKAALIERIPLNYRRALSPGVQI